MTYTVTQLGQKASVSIRTLHYYDEIGLLIPIRDDSNGYRYYREQELLKLQQILFFKELEFSLQEIKSILESPSFDIIQALQDQRSLLALKKKRFSKLIQTIDSTIEQLKGGETMNEDTLYENFNTNDIEAYKKEAKERWGHTDAYQQSQERIAKWTKTDWNRIQKQGGAVLEQLKALTDQPIGSPVVQDLIEQYHAYMNNFYDCSIELFSNLGKMYVDDDRFSQYYRERGIDPIFFRDAIVYYCNTRSNHLV